MTPTPFLLVCDHRGAGFGRDVLALAARGYRVETSDTLRRSLQRIEEGRPSLILIDPLTPGGTAELQAVDRSRASDPPIPLLIVADPGAEGRVLAAARTLRQGAWDVVWRDAKPDEVQLRIERLETVGHLLVEMGELRHRASHDDRTDLLRPNAFQARLVEHFSAAERHRFGLALVLLDLDRFGQINKRHDHTVGDALIARVGEVIRRTLRTEDVAGRLGGDEFAVLLPYTKKIDAALVVNRLREEIRGLSGHLAGARGGVVVSASIGFETFDGTDIDSVETLRHHAERAMKAAKVGGGDRGVYFRTVEET